MIEVTEKSDYQFTVRTGDETFEVTVRPEYLEELFGDRPPDAEKIIRASFEFLLEREPQSQIMKQFDLSIIETYFPEYRAEIVKMAL